MKILITDHDPDLLGGAETVVRDLAVGLRERGHSVQAFSSQVGPTGQSFARLGIPVTVDPKKMSFRPDIIHAQHHLDAMIAIAALPGVPAVYHCHGGGFHDTQPKHPRIVRYVAITPTLKLRLAAESGIAESAIDVLPNAVDLNRFCQVRTPQARPQRALLYSNQLRRDYMTTEVLEEAAATSGLALDLIGRRFGTTIPNPETVLPQYDIVFASGKSAIEALCCGCSVVVLGSRGCGEMVNEGNVERLRAANFSIPVNSPPPTVAGVCAEIARYDAERCAAVTRRLRREADLDIFVTAMEAIYEDVAAVHARARPDLMGEQRALTAYLRNLVSAVHTLEEQRRWDGLTPIVSKPAAAGVVSQLARA